MRQLHTILIVHTRLKPGQGWRICVISRIAYTEVQCFIPQTAPTGSNKISADNVLEMCAFLHYWQIGTSHASVWCSVDLWWHSRSGNRIDISPKSISAKSTKFFEMPSALFHNTNTVDVIRHSPWRVIVHIDTEAADNIFSVPWQMQHSMESGPLVSSWERHIR